MPKNRQEQYRIIYANAKSVAVRNIDSIMKDLFPDADVSSRYYHMGSMIGGSKGSMWVYRTGDKIGSWVDAGTPKTKRKTGDIIHLIAEKLFNGNTFEAVEYILGVYK